MKAIYSIVLAGAIALTGVAQTQSANRSANIHSSDRERLIGAWHLVHIDVPGPNGKPADIPQPAGMLVYTRDGHISVQLMYPKSPNASSDEYVLNGYEASFGSYELDETTHTVIHHVQASITRDLLVGKDLPRSYQFTHEGHLVIKSMHPEEHWSVTWEHY